MNKFLVLHNMLNAFKIMSVLVYGTESYFNRAYLNSRKETTKTTGILNSN